MFIGRIFTSCRVVNNYKPVRLFSSCSKTLQQFSENGSNRSNYQQGSHARFLLPMVLGFSLFGKAEPTDNEQEAKSSEKQEIVEDEVISVLKRAKLKEIRQELYEAEQIYHKAIGLLNIYEQNKSWDKKRLVQARVYIYDSLANLALARGEFAKAEKLYKETLRGSLQQGMSKDHDAVVEISLKLAMIYAAQKRNEEANDGYKFCIKTQEEKIGKMKEVDDNSAALLGMALDAYSRFLMVQNRNEEAKSNLEKSLGIATKIYGESHPQVAVLLNDIATVGSQMQDYSLAKKNLEKAVKIAETVESPDLPTFYFNLGAIYERQGELTEASDAYKKALTTAKKTDDKAVQKKAKNALDSLKNLHTKK